MNSVSVFSVKNSIDHCDAILFRVAKTGAEGSLPNLQTIERLRAHAESSLGEPSQLRSPVCFTCRNELIEPLDMLAEVTSPGGSFISVHSVTFESDQETCSLCNRDLFLSYPFGKVYFVINPKYAHKLISCLKFLSGYYTVYSYSPRLSAFTALVDQVLDCPSHGESQRVLE